MSILNSIIQGIVQGLTEFLPVSSSGHLLIAQHILGIQENNLFFNVMLHLGTLLAVLAVYYKLVIKLIKAAFELCKDIFTGNFKWTKLEKEKRMLMMLIVACTPLFLLFLPILGAGMTFKDLAKTFAESSSLTIVGFSLLATSLLLFLGILKSRGNRFNSNLPNIKKSFNIGDALSVGFAQLVAAIFPGLSRSGTTLSVGLFRGINKQDALDFSFVLGMPSILAAAAVEFKDATEVGISGISFTSILIGFIVAAIVGFISIKLFRWLLKTDRMIIFVIYTLIAGLGALVISLIEFVNGYNVFTGV